MNVVLNYNPEGRPKEMEFQIWFRHVLDGFHKFDLTEVSDNVNLPEDHV